MEAVRSVEKRERATMRTSEMDGMPEEAKMFLKCIGMFKCPGQGAIVINNVNPPHKSGWKRMRVTVDSGAAESVIPVDEVLNYKKHLREKDEWFQTASGEPIKNEGEQRIPVVLPSGQMRGMTFQACDVTKPLASVKRMMDAGHAVVFAPEEFGGSFVLNLETGDDEILIEEDGNYYMDVWIPPPDALPGFVRQP